MLICDKARECTFREGCPHKDKHEKMKFNYCELVGCYPVNPDVYIKSKCIEVIEC